MGSAVSGDEPVLLRRRAGDIVRAAIIVRCQRASTSAVSSATPSCVLLRRPAPAGGPFPSLSIAAWVAAPADAPPSACVFLVAVTAAAVPAAFTLSVSDYLPGAGAVSLDLVSADGQRTRLGNFSGGTVRVDRTVAGRSIEMLEMSPL